MTISTFNAALRAALHEEMARDETVFVMGEDVIVHGGPFKVTEGLAERFPGRVFETPIAEAGIVGLAVGAAMVGMRPIVEVMYMDFITCAMDEVVNQAAKMRYMSGGNTCVPMVVRLPCGIGRNLAAQHSQSMEAWFMHVPGLQIAVPSTPADAKGLLKTAIRSSDPVMFFEYKMLYGSKGEVGDESQTVPFGLADVKREGEDVSVIAIGSMVPKALQAAIALEDAGWDAEIVDPRTLSPLDRETICASVRKTGHAVVCGEGSSFCGATAELSAMIAETCFGDLKAPVLRVGSPHVPMPFSPDLVRHVVPEAAEIVAAVDRLIS